MIHSKFFRGISGYDCYVMKKKIGSVAYANGMVL